MAVLLLAVGKIALVDPLVERLRADRRAADDRLRRARRCCCSPRASRCRPRARASRCAASCGSRPSARRLALRCAAPCRASLALVRSPPSCCWSAGICLGGHPDGCPGSSRDPLVGDQDTRVVARRSTTIHDTLLPQDPGVAAGRRRDHGRRRARCTTASRTTSRPKEYKRFQQVSNRSFSGIGLDGPGDPRGLRIVARLRRARRPSARGPAAGRPDRRRRRARR